MRRIAKKRGSMASPAIPASLAFFCKLISPWTSPAGIDGLREAVADKAVDWAALATHANRANLAPALRHALVQRGFWEDVPESLRDYLDIMFDFNTRRSTTLREELFTVTGALNAADITPMLIKGAAALATDLYPATGIRFMWDLDLLIPEARLPRAVATLRARGYRVPEKILDRRRSEEHRFRDKHYPPLIRPEGPAPIELHSRLLDTPHPLLETSAVWRDRVEMCMSDQRALSLAVMSPTHQLIHCFVHSELAHGNHRSRRLDLRQLSHFAVLCHRYHTDVDWDRFSDFFREPVAGRVLKSYLTLAQSLFGVVTPMSFPPEADDLRHLSRLLYYLDGRWRRLRAIRDTFCFARKALSRERLQIVYPIEFDHTSIHALRWRHLCSLMGRYARLAPWKKRFTASLHRFDSLG